MVGGVVWPPPHLLVAPPLLGMPLCTFTGQPDTRLVLSSQNIFFAAQEKHPFDGLRKGTSIVNQQHSFGRPTEVSIWLASGNPHTVGPRGPHFVAHSWTSSCPLIRESPVYRVYTVIQDVDGLDICLSRFTKKFKFYECHRAM